MVAVLFHPLNIFLLGLGGGFAIPLLYRLGKVWLSLGFHLALAGITLVSGMALLGLVQGGETIEVLTAGAAPPVAINLRYGLWEGFFAFSCNLVALLGALHLRDRLAGNYGAMLLYLILVMGIDGMIMTRDLFNLFVFLEIVSIATYGLLGLERAPAALSAAFKYIMATVVASSLFLLGTMLIYYVTGTLNIDELIDMRASIAGPIGAAGLLMVLACLVLELKPFPANGWGLDVYETAPSGIASMISVGVTAGVFFALFKLLPLFEDYLGIIALSGAVTFLFSNLAGLSQTKVQRLLGYSSISQMGLLMLALAVLTQLGAQASIPLVIGGLYLNHLLSKAGLFWLAGIFRLERVDSGAGALRRPLPMALIGLLLVAIAGLPPFPGFWAKWELVMRTTQAEEHFWTFVILVGSLLEAAYMFRWFVRLLHREPAETKVGPGPGFVALIPVLGVTVLLLASAWGVAAFAGVVAADMASLWLLAPLVVGGLLFLLDTLLPGRTKAVIMLVTVLVAGLWLAVPVEGIARLFAVLLLAGGLVIAAAGLYRSDARPGYYPLLAVLLLAITTLMRSSTSLEFFFTWEVITLASFFLIARSPRAHGYVLSFLLFSLFSAYFLLAGFAGIAALSNTTDLAALMGSGPDASVPFALLAAGFLIKAGTIGVHVWLPGTYAEADDDFSAMLSGVVSKVAIFGLLLVTYLAIRSETSLELAHAMAWAGMLTTIAGALMALRQQDFKRLLAFSSMSQLGYIVTAIALMSHLGWVTALYLVANHMMVKGILFLGVAGIIARTGTRLFGEVGGLGRAMPLTFAAMLVAIVSMSGLPPLMGFGGKWLLLSAMVDKGWHMLALAGLFATFLGFLYMVRLMGGLFFGQLRAGCENIREASPFLLAPQFLLIGGILVLSFFPKLLIEPVAAAIDPQFAAGLVWDGMALESIYAYWNPTPVLIVALMVTILLFLLFWGRYRTQGRAGSMERFYAFYRPLIGRTLPSLAIGFWQGITGATLECSGLVRRLYTGNGQTYVLYVIYYFLALYLAGTGLAGIGLASLGGAGAP